MPQYRFLDDIRSSNDYTGGPQDWQYTAEVELECLFEMARHGDREAFQSLRYLGHKITKLISRMTEMAQNGCSDRINLVFKDVDWEKREDADWESAVTDEDLNQISAVQPDELENIINTIVENCPADPKLFPARFLTDVRRNPGLKSRPETEKRELPNPTHFDVLDKLTGALAGIRARWEVVRMVRDEIAHAESWTVNLPSIEEFRSIQLQKFDNLQIGSACDLTPYLRKGKGRPPSKIAGDDSAELAFIAYRALNQERTRHREYGEIEEIRKSYEACKESLSAKKKAHPKDGDAHKAGAGRNHEKNFLGFALRDLEEQLHNWTPENEWRAAAALLEPLTTDPNVIKSWVDAGTKLFYVSTSRYVDVSHLPEQVKNTATKSNKDPSPKRVKKTIENALSNGFKMLSKRIKHKKSE